MIGDVVPWVPWCGVVPWVPVVPGSVSRKEGVKEGVKSAFDLLRDMC